MLLDDIATYLAASSTRFGVGISLTVSIQPAAPGTLTSLYEAGGVSPVHYFSTGAQTREFERPSMQVIARSTSYQVARANIEEVFTLLDGIHDRGLPTTTGTHYQSVDAIQSPFPLGRDENERWRLAVNFTITKSTG